MAWTDGSALPIEALEGRVGSEEIDANRHMSAESYLRLFHRALPALFRPLGFGPDYRARGFATFQREIHLTYDAELRLDDPFLVRIWLVEHDEKRLHHFYEMSRGRGGDRVATAEIMTLNVGFASRRTTPFPEDVLARLDALADRFARIPAADGTGARIGMRRSRRD